MPRSKVILLGQMALGLSAPAALADSRSLERGPGPRPGPPILYASAPKASQLTNAAPWRAKPILISGASAYRRGEFLYQDFLYDDHGARGEQDPDDPLAANTGCRERRSRPAMSAPSRR